MAMGAQGWAVPYGRDFEERNPLILGDGVFIFPERSSDYIMSKEKKKDGGWVAHRFSVKDGKMMPRKRRKSSGDMSLTTKGFSSVK